MPDGQMAIAPINRCSHAVTNKMVIVIMAASILLLFSGITPTTGGCKRNAFNNPVACDREAESLTAFFQFKIT